MSVETVVRDHATDTVTVGDLETTARAHVRVNRRPDLAVARLTTKKALTIRRAAGGSSSAFT